MSADVIQVPGPAGPSGPDEPAGPEDERPLADVGPQPGAASGSRRSAARMAARDLRRHPWRTLLILLLIGLPVFGVAFGSVITASTSLPSQAEEHRQWLWGFDGYLAPGEFGDRDLQSPTDPHGAINAQDAADGTYGATIDLEALDEAAQDWPVCPAGTDPAAGCSLQEALPAGADATFVTTARGSLEMPGSSVDVEIVIADFSRPDLQGEDRRFQLLDGGLAGDGQVMASPGLLTELDAANERAEVRGLAAAPTDRVELELPGGGTAGSSDPISLAISGTQLDRSQQWATAMDLVLPLRDGHPVLYVPAGSEAAAAFEVPGEVTAYLTGDVPDDYASYRAFNEAGFSVLFAPVMENPGEIGAIFDSLWSSAQRWMIYLPLVFIGVLALAETGLLAGAAFAVGARQQRRATALLSVTGAEPATLRQTMVFSGLWCGLVGAFGAALLGVGLALGLLWAADARHVLVYGPHVPWWVVSLAVVLGLACAVVAAWIPARAAARQDAWAAIKGASGERKPASRRLFVAGLVLVGAGVLIAAGAMAVGMAVPTIGDLNRVMGALALLFVGSAMLLLLGMLMLLPSTVTGLARLGGRLPVSLRMAARDAHRNRTRTVPVAAAVVAATAVGAAVLCSVAMTAHGIDGGRQGAPTADTGYVWVQDRAEIQRALDQEASYAEGGEAPTADDLGLYTGGARGVVKELQGLSAVPGAPRMVEQWQVHRPQSSCAVDYSADCFELLPLYPEGSTCHIPIPDGPTVDDRRLAVDEAGQAMSRADGVTCGIEAGTMGSPLDPDPLTNIMVVDPLRPETVPLPMFGGDEDLLAAVRSGQAVVSDPEYVDADGRVTLGEFTLDVDAVPGVELGEEDRIWIEEMEASGDPTAGITGFSAVQGSSVLWKPEHSVSLDAVVVPELEGDQPIAIIPVTALAGMDQSMVLDGVLARFAEPVTEEQNALASDVLGSEDLWLSSMFEGGSGMQPLLWGIAGATALLVFSVAGMTTGLALADARRDQTVLSSVGANPRTRKSMAAAQTFTGALLGTLLGVPVGAVAVIGIGAVQFYSVEWIPWLQLAVLVIGVPVLAAALTWLVVPGTLPIRQRDRD
ncbi:FtsX-like permease family protein [Citricoccus sp. K5]|uniref:FtsX-like permease family protein n=1 Tax=Citricoccus sp. K5 TaxID=2653135 RepID=UPI00135C9F9E|nr:FtsX-like permease family protein [Citricoccus sp. K5]